MGCARGLQIPAGDSHSPRSRSAPTLCTLGPPSPKPWRGGIEACWRAHRRRLRCPDFLFANEEIALEGLGAMEREAPEKAAQAKRADRQGIRAGQRTFREGSGASRARARQGVGHGVRALRARHPYGWRVRNQTGGEVSHQHTLPTARDDLSMTRRSSSRQRADADGRYALCARSQFSVRSKSSIHPVILVSTPVATPEPAAASAPARRTGL